jgi:predicted DNA-binding transcriptional regulator YafY
VSATLTKPRAATKADPVGEAIKLLRPLADEDDDAAAIVVALEALSPAGDDEDAEDDSALLEKAMSGMRTQRAKLAKSATRDPGLLGRLDTISRDLQRAYLRKHETAYGNPEVAQHLP